MSKSKGQIREPLNSRQRSILVTFYNQNPYPSANERQQLVQLTGRTMKQIQDWFSNRRRVDPNLISEKPTTTPRPSPPSAPIENVPSGFYYTPMTSMPLLCPCCYHTSLTPMVEPWHYFIDPNQPDYYKHQF